MTFPDLLDSVLSSFIERTDGGRPTKTKLLKLAYLAEVEYLRRHRKRLTNAPWIYFLYGPYISDYDEILSREFELEEVETADEHTAMLVSPRREKRTQEPNFDAKMVIDAIINEFGDMLFKDLLDYVYFETEPMIDAKSRGRPLNFEIVKPAAYYKVVPLSIPQKVEKEIREKYRRLAKERHGE
jgi:hypothetical protein